MIVENSRWSAAALLRFNCSKNIFSQGNSFKEATEKGWKARTCWENREENSYENKEKVLGWIWGLLEGVCGQFSKEKSLEAWKHVL